MERIPNRLIVVGVAHTSEHPSYQATLDWVDENVKKGMRIGLEGFHEDDPYLHDAWVESERGGKIMLPKHLRGNQGPIQVVSYETGLYSPSEMYEFVDKVRQRIETNGAIPVQVDHLSALNRSARYHSLKNEAAIRANEALHEIQEKEFELELGFGQNRSGILVHKPRLWLPTGPRLTREDEEELEELRVKYQKLKTKCEEMQKNEYVTDVLRSKSMLRNSLGLHATILGGAHAEDIADYAPHIRNKRVIFLGFDDPRPTMGGIRVASMIGLDTQRIQRLKKSFRQVQEPNRQKRFQMNHDEW